MSDITKENIIARINAGLPSGYPPFRPDQADSLWKAIVDANTDPAEAVERIIRNVKDYYDGLPNCG